METYRIEKMPHYWGLFKGWSSRPMERAASQSEITLLASQILAGRKASIKISNLNGTFEEFRFERNG